MEQGEPRAGEWWYGLSSNAVGCLQAKVSARMMMMVMIGMDQQLVVVVLSIAHVDTPLPPYLLLLSPENQYLPYPHPNPRLKQAKPKYVIHRWYILYRGVKVGIC